MEDTTLRRQAAYGAPEFVIVSVDLDRLGQHDALFSLLQNLTILGTKMSDISHSRPQDAT